MKNVKREDRLKIERAYKELEDVRKLLRLSAGDDSNEFIDSLNAEENRLIRFISNLKGLNEPNMN